MSQQREALVPLNDSCHLQVLVSQRSCFCSSGGGVCLGAWGGCWGCCDGLGPAWGCLPCHTPHLQWWECVVSEARPLPLLLRLTHPAAKLHMAY